MDANLTVVRNIICVPYGFVKSGDGSEASKMIDEAFNLLNRAWDLYYGVFRKINKQLPQVRIT